MSGKIKIHLMMLIAFLLCNASSMVLAVGMAITSEENTNMVQESVVSAASKIDGHVVEMLPPKKAMGTTDTLRGKRFEWLGQAEQGVAEEERFNTVDRALNLDAVSVY